MLPRLTAIDQGQAQFGLRRSDSGTVLYEQPESLSAIIRRYVEEEIIEGILPPGARLALEGLGKRFGVSISPVRDALLALEKDGLVTSRPRVGYFVSEISLEDIEEIYPIRAQLYALAIRDILETGFEPEFLEELEDFLQHMETAAGKEDYQGFFYSAVKRDEYILARSSNERLSRMVIQLGKIVQHLRYRIVSIPGRAEKIIAEFKDLLEALRQEDISLAMRRAEQIILNEKDVIREQFLTGASEEAITRA